MSHPKDDSWNLTDFSRSLNEQNDRRDEQRKNHNAALEAQGAIKFVPDQEDEIAAKGFGVGYFQIGLHLVAYRRYANGYEMYPCMAMEVALVKELADKLL